ncbi:MAG: hypothetical protein V4508_10115 [Pseudomonadota bacterium]
MEQARRDFAAGRLRSAAFVRVPMSVNDWTMRLVGSKGEAGMLLEIQTLQARIFTSLDNAVHAAEQIGFPFDELHLK